jgi:ParB-like nuclease domain
MTVNIDSRAMPTRKRASKDHGMSDDRERAPRLGLKGNKIRVQAMAIGQIKLNPRNSRTHPAKQIRQIANSIEAFGFTNPLLVTENEELIAGEGRYKAAQLLGRTDVPVIVLAGLSPTKRSCTRDRR